MKHFRKYVALLLTLATVFSLTVFASATEINLIKTSSKSLDVGTTASLRGEVWNYSYVYNGIPWHEPTVKAIVTSPKTMSEITCDVLCQYNDTGEQVNENSAAYDYVRNANELAVNLGYSIQRKQSIALHSMINVTYSRSDYMVLTTLL